MERKNGGILENLEIFWPPKLTPTTLKILKEEENQNHITNRSETQLEIPKDKGGANIKEEERECFFEFDEDYYYISKKLKILLNY